MARSSPTYRHDRGVLSRCVCAAVIVALGAGVVPPAHAQAIVFDPSNYSQNLLTAARALDQINNQLRGLDNQARLLINSTKNVTGLPASVAGQFS